MKRILGMLLLLLTVVPAALLIWLWPSYEYLPAQPLQFRAERVLLEPIVHAGLSDSLSAVAGDRASYNNINGPSLIRVPEWVVNPLGKYYLYFAHHKGDRIRLAYADDLRGPWKIHEPGALTLSDSGFPTQLDAAETDEALAGLWQDYSIHVVRDMLLLAYRATVTDQDTREARGIAKAANSQPHIASPEIFIDNYNKRLVMYFHGLVGKTAQHTYLAQSSDGLNFTSLPGKLRSNYLRTFEYEGQWYGLAMPGILFRSDSGVGDFEARDKLLFEPNMRHAGLWLRGNTLFVFWSRVGAAPERILVSRVDLSSSDWDDWQATRPLEIMRPKKAWEGSELIIESSLRGELDLPANELRDPFIFVDDDGQPYLLYVGGGEQAIGLARLVKK